MKRIKYRNQGLRVLFAVLGIFALVFTGAVPVYFLSKFRMEEMRNNMDCMEQENAFLNIRLEELTKPKENTREVWLSYVERSDYVYSGDVVDLRIVNSEGTDTKLLAGKTITCLDEKGMQVVVDEAELEILTAAEFEMAKGTAVKIYAVVLP